MITPETAVHHFPAISVFLCWGLIWFMHTRKFLLIVLGPMQNGMELLTHCEAGMQAKLVSCAPRVLLQLKTCFADALDLSSLGKAPFYTPTSSLIHMYPLYKPQLITQHAGKTTCSNDKH